MNDLKSSQLQKCFRIFALLFLVAIPKAVAALNGRDYAVELTADLKLDPPEIRLQWPGDQYARKYTVHRKGRDEKTWNLVGLADGPETGFTDRGVLTGTAYEYRVIKESSFGQMAYGYIYSGINVPLVEDRGRVILLVEEGLAVVLKTELDRLEYDLIGDGWRVARATVKQTDSPPSVKSVIRAIYDQDPLRTRSLLLFGHIPVAYSGNIMPDGHENHQGAWPADVYYADLDGSWTDTTVDSTGAELSRNWNVPGDGKFDQSLVPSAVELETGRVDLSNLTCFLNKTPSRTEVDLARYYLEKDHRFRHGMMHVEQRGLLFDRIESITAEPVMAAGWRTMVPFVGSENIERIGDNDYFPRVSTGTYLWSAVCAGGGYVHSDRVGTSDAFALNDAKVVFTTFLGSYYGDWDMESAFLRAALGGNGMLLTTVYSGQPQWLFHHMALGEVVGYAARITQDNGTNGVYAPHNNGAGEVHISLLGDPTLRAHPIPSPRNLIAERGPDGLALKWDQPAVENLQGYNVYRASNSRGPYDRITLEPLTEPQITIPNARASDYFMIKTLAITRSPSGSYYNSSEGMIFPDPLADLLNTAPQAPTNLVTTGVSPSAIGLSWVSRSPNAASFRIERKAPGETNFTTAGEVSADFLSYEDRNLPRPGIYRYRVRAINAVGASAPSNEATATTLSAWAEFVGVDASTHGSWIDRYGKDGYILSGLYDRLPDFTTLSVSNTYSYKPGFTDDPRALEIPESRFRSANCWAASTPCAFHLNFTDDQVHQLAFYIAAWGRQGTVLDFDVIDAVSGVSLDRRKFEEINEGIYAVYNVRRQVYVQITPPSIFTIAEIYGVFVDPATLGPVQINAAGGEFSGKTQITMTSASAGTEIHYTTDGSFPDRNSPRYTDPFWLTTDGWIRAAAFRDGFPAGPVAEASFKNTLVSMSGFVKWDSNTGGNWTGRYGSEGYWIPFGGKFVSGYAEATRQSGSEWSWSDVTSDTRAPWLDQSAFIREAVAWYDAESLLFDINVYDTKLHAVSFYFLDWDKRGREERVEILDRTGISLAEYNVSDFQEGRYLMLAMKGQFKVRISRVTGDNVILSGLFFDAAPPELFAPRPVPLTEVGVSEGALHFNLAGFPGMQVCTDRSLDLKTWECTATNSFESTNLRISLPVPRNGPGQFFRTHFVQ